MWPHRRQELLLMGVAAFMQLLQPTTSDRDTDCPSTHFVDDGQGCQPCQRCPKNLTWADRTGHDEFNTCELNNPNPVMVLESRDIYLWCHTESRWVSKTLREQSLKTSTTVRTETPTHSTTVNATNAQPTVTLVRESKPDNSGNVTFPLIGVGVSLLFVVLIVGLIVWVVRRRRWQSLSSLPTESDGLSEESQELKPNEIIIDSPEPYRIGEAYQETPEPCPICVNIFTTPNIRVSKGDHVMLDASKEWGDDSVVWLHKSTSTKYFGSKITIFSILYIQGGEYIASIVSASISVTITVVRPGEENEEPQPLIVCVRQPVEYGPEAVESSTETGSPEENEMSIALWQPLIVYQPESGASNAPIVPSGQSHVRLHNIVEQVNSLINFADQRREVEYRRCTLDLRKLLQDAVATPQLAILLDPTSMLRLFAAKKGGLSVDQIDFIWYCTKGTGNTIRGLFQHLVDKGYGDCTAADFSNFMIEARWKGCDKVIHLMYQVHIKRKEHCTECEALHKSHGPKEMSGDVRLQNILPGYQYHLTNDACYCDQTVYELSRCAGYGEPFRQDSAELFCVNELWRLVGSDLVGMSMEFLEQIQKHYEGAERYYQMLDYLVELYPELKVATLLQWLLDGNHISAAKLVLTHHETQMLALQPPSQCDFCRDIRFKPAMS